MVQESRDTDHTDFSHTVSIMSHSLAVCAWYIWKNDFSSQYLWRTTIFQI